MRTIYDAIVKGLFITIPIYFFATIILFKLYIYSGPIGGLLYSIILSLSCLGVTGIVFFTVMWKSKRNLIKQLRKKKASTKMFYIIIIFQLILVLICALAIVSVALETNQDMQHLISLNEDECNTNRCCAQSDCIINLKTPGSIVTFYYPDDFDNRFLKLGYRLTKGKENIYIIVNSAHAKGFIDFESYLHNQTALLKNNTGNITNLSESITMLDRHKANVIDYDIAGSHIRNYYVPLDPHYFLFIGMIADTSDFLRLESEMFRSIEDIRIISYPNG